MTALPLGLVAAGGGSCPGRPGFAEAVQAPQHLGTELVAAPPLAPEAGQRAADRGVLTRLAGIAVEALVDRVADRPLRVDDQRAAAVHVENRAAAGNRTGLRDFGDEVEDDPAVGRGAARHAD